MLFWQQFEPKGKILQAELDLWEVSSMTLSQKKKDAFSIVAHGFCQARATMAIFIYMGNQLGNVSECLGRSCLS